MIIKLLAIAGAASLLVILFYIFIFVFHIIIEYLSDKEREREYKNRFDKPPLAKCYCVDCIYGKYNHKNKDVTCMVGNINHTADSWFCADATPRTTSPNLE